jgi:hypothetical protein
MNRKSIVIALALSAVSLKAQTQATSPLASPQVGVVHCPDGSLRTLYGLPANFLYGALLGRGINAAAFSNAAGLVFRSGRIEYLATDGTTLDAYVTDEQNPLLAVGPVSAGGPSTPAIALAWLPSTQVLLNWSGGTASPVQVWPSPGNVISLSPAATGFANLMVASADGGVERLTVSLATGQIVESSTVMGANGVAYQQNGFVLVLGADGLQVQFPNGHQQLLAIRTGPLRFEAVSDGWVHLSIPRTSSNAGSDWLLHLDGALQAESPLQLSELPGTPIRTPKILPRQVGQHVVGVPQ